MMNRSHWQNLYRKFRLVKAGASRINYDRWPTAIARLKVCRSGLASSAYYLGQAAACRRHRLTELHSYYLQLSKLSAGNGRLP